MSKDSKKMDLLHGKLGIGSKKYRTAVLTIIRDQFAEMFESVLPELTCPCGRKVSIKRMFRCFHCGIWFCRVCGREHFGKGHG